MARVAISGANGRMGKMLIECIGEYPELELTGLIVKPDDFALTTGLSHLALIPTGDLEDIIDDFDILIDFSIPRATLRHVAICQQYQKKMIIGTTGFTKAEREVIQQASHEIAILLAPNTSFGTQTFFKLLKKAALLNLECDVEIIDIHHHHKRDAPSGTALKMGEIIASTRNQSLDEIAIFDRAEPTEKQIGKIGFSSLRAGDIIGEHTAMFVHHGERLEITHRVTNRQSFAQGALKAAVWLHAKTTGFYQMEDIIVSQLA